MPRGHFAPYRPVQISLRASLSWFVLWAEDGGICYNTARPQPCLHVTAGEPHVSSPFRVNVFEKREVRKVRFGFAGGWVGEDHRAHAPGQM